MIVEHDRETTMIEVIELTTDRAKLDHDLMVAITSGAPGQTVGFANFMLRNALLYSDRNDSYPKAFLNTTKDREIAEYSALSKTYHPPQPQVLLKISQSFGSFLGLADMGIRHLVRQK